jgi:hypothetical protein
LVNHDDDNQLGMTVVGGSVRRAGERGTKEGVSQQAGKQRSEEAFHRVGSLQPACRRTKANPLSFKPIVPIPVWADKTPNIAGLPGWEDKDAVKFLMTGMAYNSLPGRPPMPQYRFNQEDASAIVAYLRSLAPVATSASKK